MKPGPWYVKVRGGGLEEGDILDVSSSGIKVTRGSSVFLWTTDRIDMSSPTAEVKASSGLTYLLTQHDADKLKGDCKPSDGGIGGSWTAEENSGGGTIGWRPPKPAPAAPVS